jgi:tryptophan synthase alpha chain
VAALRAAARHADILEVGVPFSDPVADGPTIQRSSFVALERGATLEDTLAMIAEADLAIPVVLFSYLNPILQFGAERLLTRADAVGVAGVLLTDLPAGADPAIERLIDDSSLDRIRLVAPTTHGDRLDAVTAGAEGFLYLVARLGVTGASRALEHGLAAQVAAVRRVSALPVAVGFGISTASQAAEVAAFADGVVVGSAAVEALATGGVAALEALLGSLRAAITP